MSERGLADVPFLLVGGRDMLASVVEKFDEMTEATMDETTGIGPVHGLWRSSKGTGELAAGLTQEGLFNPAVGGVHEALNGNQETSQVVSYGFDGGAIGALVTCLWGAFGSKYKRSLSRLKLHRASCGYTVSGRKDDDCPLLHGATEETGATWNSEASSVDTNAIGLTPLTIDTLTEAAATVVATTRPHNRTTNDIVVIAGVAGSSPDVNGSHQITVVDEYSFTIPVNTAAGEAGTVGTALPVGTQDGGRGYLHVEDLTLGGYDSATVNVRHSADNVTFATAMSFTVVTAAPSAEPKAMTGAVNRYLATSGSYTGSGSGQSITPVVAFKRI